MHVAECLLWVESGHCQNAMFEGGTVRTPLEYGIIHPCDPGLEQERHLASAQKLSGERSDREAVRPRFAASGLDNGSD